MTKALNSLDLASLLRLPLGVATLTVTYSRNTNLLKLSGRGRGFLFHRWVPLGVARAQRRHTRGDPPRRAGLAVAAHTEPAIASQ